MNKKEEPGLGGLIGSERGKAAENLSIEKTSHPLLCQSTHAQRQRIFAWLQSSPLYTLEGQRSLGVLHPEARVLELKRQGHKIRSEWDIEYSAGGSEHRVARYILQQSERRSHD